MTAQWISIKSAGGGEYGAYLSLPPAGKGPGLILFQEIFGVNEHIRAVADQYALDGYVVLTPDIFWRQAPRVELGYEGDDMKKAIDLKNGLPLAIALDDIVTSITALRKRPEVVGKIGAFGYCMGGRFAYLSAAKGLVDSAVSFYGGGIQDNLDLASNIQCPLQFHYAEQDHAISLDAVEKVRTALASKQTEFHIYAGAGHGFNCWARAAYHQPSAVLAHGRTLLHFAKTLG